jgi:hypothetical protein
MRYLSLLSIFVLISISSSQGLAQTNPGPTGTDDIAVVTDDEFRAMTREEQAAYILARHERAARRNNRLHQINDNGFDSDLDQVQSSRLWACRCNAGWMTVHTLQGGAQVLLGCFALAGIMTNSPWLLVGSGALTFGGVFLGRTGDFYTEQANTKLKEAEAINEAEARDLLAKIKIFNENIPAEHIQEAVNRAAVLVTEAGPTERNAALRLMNGFTQILWGLVPNMRQPPQQPEMGRAVPAGNPMLNAFGALHDDIGDIERMERGELSPNPRRRRWVNMRVVRRHGDQVDVEMQPHAPNDNNAPPPAEK